MASKYGYNYAVAVMRTVAGVTIAKLAEEIGISAATISNVENWRTPLKKPEKIARYAQAFGCSMRTLDLLAMGPSERQAAGYGPDDGELGALLAEIGCYDDEYTETEDTEDGSERSQADG